MEEVERCTDLGVWTYALVDGVFEVWGQGCGKYEGYVFPGSERAEREKDVGEKGRKEKKREKIGWREFDIGMVVRE